MTPSSQLDAALSLLDDPDPVVQRSIRDHMLAQRRDAVPALHRLIERGDEPLRTQATAVLREIGIRAFRSEISDVARSHAHDDDIDLELGTFAIVLLRYPEFAIESYSQQLDTMAAIVDERLRSAVSGVHVIREMNRYLVEELGFHGCRSESFNDPDNSYMNRVLDRRIGLPITLSAVYLFIAQRLDLPIYGVGFPMQYLLKYHAGHEEFFIDPFGGGTLLSRGDCVRMLESRNFAYRPELLQPASNRATIARMMHNLLNIYQTEDPELGNELEAAIRVVEG